MDKLDIRELDQRVAGTISWDTAKIKPIEKKKLQWTQILKRLNSKLWGMLKKPKNRDEILRIASGGSSEVLTALVTLDLRGLIREEFGTWHKI